jgi:hypothetical protein
MIKGFAQVLGGLCLFLAVVLFPSKIGFIAVEVFNAAWNIVVTIGRHIRVPGEGTLILLQLLGS